MLWSQPKQQRLEALDGREVAPQRSRPDDLLTPTGDPLPWPDPTARPDGIGIPGMVALLWEAHQPFGRLNWAGTMPPPSSGVVSLRQTLALLNPFMDRLRFSRDAGHTHSPCDEQSAQRFRLCAIG